MNKKDDKITILYILADGTNIELKVDSQIAEAIEESNRKQKTQGSLI